MALVAIPFVVFLRCIFRRFSKVELSETHLTGPWRHSIFLRRAILREKIYRARSGKRSFLAKWYGYWDLFTDTGECVRVPCALLGPEQTEALMSELGFVSDEAKWARWRNDFAWFVLAAWTVFAYLITKPSP